MVECCLHVCSLLLSGEYLLLFLHFLLDAVHLELLEPFKLTLYLGCLLIFKEFESAFLLLLLVHCTLLPQSLQFTLHLQFVHQHFLLLFQIFLGFPVPLLQLTLPLLHLAVGFLHFLVEPFIFLLPLHLPFHLHLCFQTVEPLLLLQFNLLSLVKPI